MVLLMQVPLGVQLLNENKLDELCSIMKNNHSTLQKLITRLYTKERKLLWSFSKGYYLEETN